MSRSYFDSLLHELFEQDADIPAATEQRLNEAYEQIRRMQAPKRADLGDHINGFAASVRKAVGRIRTLPDSIRSRSGEISRRTVVTAAAAVLAIVCAGGVLAYGITHKGLFDTVWGGKPGTTVGIYQSADGITCEFPAFEQVELDMDTAESVLGKYVVSCGQTYRQGDSTITILDYMCDDNGMGCVSYSIENPSGVGCVSEQGSRFVQSMDAHEPQFYTADHSTMNQYVLINKEMSSGTKVFLSSVFTAKRRLSDDEGLLMEIEADDNSGERTTLTVELPAFTKIPSLAFCDEQSIVAAHLSPLGMTLGKADSAAADVSPARLTVVGSKGEYVVLSEDESILNVFSSTELTDSNTINYVFNRMVNPAEVTGVTVDGTMLLPTDNPPETSYMITSPDNPFSYINSDGATVYVLSADAIESATDEQLRQCCTELFGGELSRSDLMQLYSARLDEGDISADEAIKLVLDKFGDSFDIERSVIAAELCRYDRQTAAWTIGFDCGSVSAVVMNGSVAGIDYLSGIVVNEIVPKLTPEVEAMLMGHVFTPSELSACKAMAAAKLLEYGCDVSAADLQLRACDADNNPTDRRSVSAGSSGEVYLPVVYVSGTPAENAPDAGFVLLPNGELELFSLNLGTAG